MDEQKIQKRAKIEEYFRNVARQENAKLQTVEMSEFGSELPEERVVINIPESLGDCLYITSLLEDARALYADKTLYIATKPQFFPVFEPLVGTLIDKVITWKPEFDDEMTAEGYAGDKKIANIVLNPAFATQRLLNYLHNAEDKSEINLTL